MIERARQFASTADESQFQAAAGVRIGVRRGKRELRGGVGTAAACQGW